MQFDLIQEQAENTNKYLNGYHQIIKIQFIDGLEVRIIINDHEYQIDNRKTDVDYIGENYSTTDIIVFKIRQCI